VIQRIEYVGGADAEGHAAHRAHVRRVRVAADIQLAGQGIAFEHDRMADAFRAFAVFQFAVQLDALLGGEVLLLEFELRRQIEQAHLALLFGNHFVEKGQVVAEEHDARGVVHLRVFAQVAFEENRRHRRDVLVAEAQIGAGEAGVARLDEDADFTFLVAACGARKFSPRRHGARLGRDRRQKDLSLHARHVERKQAAVLDDLPRDLIFTGGEFAQRNLFPARIWSISEKSVEVSTPRFWQFCL
jgi:hypothetical protein